jgi:hypothetical protein
MTEAAEVAPTVNDPANAGAIRALVNKARLLCALPVQVT